MGDIPDQLEAILKHHKVSVEEVHYSSAVFVLATPDGNEVTHQVGKWFYPSTGPQYFTHEVYTDDKKVLRDCFIIALLGGQGQGNSLTTISLGIIQLDHECYDIFEFKEKFKLQSSTDADNSSSTPQAFVKSDAGYLLELACVESDRNVATTDFGDAAHIEAKYLQRVKNTNHYYPARTDGYTDVFRVVEKVGCKNHPWNLLSSLTQEDLRKAHKQGFKDEVVKHSGIYISEQHSSSTTNLWGCLLFDICAQSLTSASIPKTHLLVPWVVTKSGRPVLTLKMVV